MRADALKEGRRSPVERLPERATMGLEVIGVEDVMANRVIGAEPGGLGREREQQPGDEQERARVDGARVADQRAHDQCDSDPGEQHRNGVGDSSPEPPQGDLEAGTGRTPIPTGVKDEPQIQGCREQREADQVDVTLIEFARSRRGALTRRGLAGRGLPCGGFAGACGRTLTRGGRLSPLARSAAAALGAQKRNRCHLHRSFDASPSTPARSW